MSVEADEAQAHGEGEKGFAMNHLPGDKKTVDQGIKKTSDFHVGATDRNGSEKSLDQADLERGFPFGGRDFV